MRIGAGVSAIALGVAMMVLPSGQGEAANTGAAVDAARLANAAAEPGNWMTHGGTYAEQRFANLDQINSDNIGKLGLAWSYDLDTNRGQEATPLVIDGIMYTTTAWSQVVALDAATGKPLWRYDPQVSKDRGKKGRQARLDLAGQGQA